MTVTFTSTTFANTQPKAPQVGNISQGGQVVTGSTKPATSDVIFLCKIPHGAIIYDCIEDHTCADTIGISFGLATGWTAGGGPSYSAFIASGAKSTFNRRAVLAGGAGSGGVTVSVSDLDPNRYGIFACIIESGSLTATATINWTVMYRMDG
jgi:hypothetical protein